MSDYHFFSDSEYAGPGSSDLIRFWDREPRQLRLRPRMNLPTFRFPDSQKFVNPIIAGSEDGAKIASFWNSFYKGSDWSFKCTYDEVVKWMNQGFILLIKNHKEIVATFAFRKITGGIICGKHNSQAAILDGLVIKPEYRKMGLASFVLAHIDKKIYSLPDFSQGILIWFREHNSYLGATLQTPIAIMNYSYIKIELIKSESNQVEKPDSEFVKHFVKKIYDYKPSLYTLASLDTSDTSVLWFFTMNALIGIADTHRLTENHESIWEIVFAANREPPHYTDLQEAIEKAALMLPCTNGILFASNGISRGNLFNPSSPWVAGKSGCLTTHVYNWMPPTFLNGDILFPHACI